MISKSFVIGLVGGARCGKSTLAKDLAKALRQMQHKSVAIASIASPLKKMTSDAWEEFQAFATGPYPQKKEKFRNVWVETAKAFRKEDQNYFLNRLLSSVTTDVVILDDVRYVNEAMLCDFTVEVTPSRRNAEHWQWSLFRKYTNLEERDSLRELSGTCDDEFVTFVDEVRDLKVLALAANISTFIK